MHLLSFLRSSLILTPINPRRLHAQHTGPKHAEHTEENLRKILKSPFCIEISWIYLFNPAAGAAEQASEMIYMVFFCHVT